MTAFGLVMLGKLVLLVVFIFCCCCVFMSESSGFSLFLIFLLFFLSFRQMSTRCSSAKALSFWREERSH